MKKKALSESNILKWTIWTVMISVLICLFIFNISSFFCGCYKIEKQSLGLFGDFYGGIIATVASILALVYIAFTFKNSKKESDFEMINRLYDNIVRDIDSIQYRKLYKHKKKGADDKDELFPKDEQELFMGIDALYNFDESHTENSNSVLNHLNLILNSFEQLILMANKRIKYKWGDMKWIMMDRIYLLYYSKILWPVYERIISDHGKSLMEGHDDFKSSTGARYTKLSLDTIDYLSGGQLSRLPKSDLRMDSNGRQIKLIDIHKKADVIQKLNSL